jgi:LAS superfamily LD-carboxypeptidase LdcB
MITSAMLTGRETGHVITLADQHRLQPACANAWQQLQHAARAAGFNLQAASSFRDFARQQAIWNGKFRGLRPVLDANSQPLDISTLTEREKIAVILRWSALPGASRHHWGSDLDVYDPDLLAEGKKLQLEPWEYQQGGYFYPLSCWLDQHLAEFGFYRPFAKDLGGVATEPWHISYYPLAQHCRQQLTLDVLLEAWNGQDIAGIDELKHQLPMIFQRFITPEAGQAS